MQHFNPIKLLFFSKRNSPAGKCTISLIALLLVCLVMKSQNISKKDFQDGKVYFKLKDNIEFNFKKYGKGGAVDLNEAGFLGALLNNYHVTQLRKLFYHTSSSVLQKTFQLKFNDATRIDELITELKKLGIIEYAEKVPMDYVIATPNDPKYTSNQSYLTKINAPQAWNLSTGDQKIVVAIVDGAISTTHPDLQANIWVNPGETPNNGIDDDGNGYIDDVNGYDVADGDNNPNPPTNAWDHGTHCAGIAAAVTNNNLGVASIGYNLSIMAVKAEVTTGDPDMISDGYDGITYAADAGANVISLSWGNSNYSQTAQNVINYAHSKGCVILAAAGNDNSSAAYYPAAYNNIIAVASTDNNDIKSSFSNYGVFVDVSAPGSNIYSTVPSASYANKSGTSMSTPLAAGLCGLILSINPNLTPDQVESCLKSTTVNIDGLNSGYAGKLGTGRIDAYAALQCVSSSLNSKPSAAFAANVTSTCTGTIVFTDQSTLNPSSWLWSFGDGTTSTLEHPAHTYLNNGSYTVKLVATNKNGSDSIVKTAYVNVSKPAGPPASATSRCGPGKVTLTATAPTGDTLKWYNSAGSLVRTGSSYIIGSLPATATYYVEDVVVPASQHVGPVDNSIGTGAEFTSNDLRRLVFDVYAPCTLVSVVMTTDSAGIRTIQVLDNAGLVVQSRNVNVPNGTNKVLLNFSLMPGTGYQIKATGNVRLYRNDSGASFPYTLGGLVSITGTDAGNTYYYFFYNWEVRTPTCISLRTAVTATINYAAVPVITQSGDTLTSSAATGYQWYFASNLIAGATSQKYTATQSGSYSVIITDANGCTASTSTTISLVGINEKKSEASFTIYPNPANNLFMLDAVVSTKGSIDVEIVNALGQTVYSTRFENSNGVLHAPVSVANLPSGVYFVSVQTSQERILHKFIKE